MEKYVKFSDVVLALRDDYVNFCKSMNELKKYIEIVNPIVEDFNLSIHYPKNGICATFDYKPNFVFNMKEKLGITHYKSWYALLTVSKDNSVRVDGFKTIKVTDEEAFSKKYREIAGTEFFKQMGDIVYLKKHGSSSIWTFHNTLSLDIQNGGTLNYSASTDTFIHFDTDDCASPMSLDQMLNYQIDTDLLPDFVKKRLSEAKIGETELARLVEPLRKKEQNKRTRIALKTAKD